ncbi:hypothetical protein [Streptomyces olivaceoviridis]|uniref:hypothetical protein n=1 Tax=Streptomyces olivaceoviridis TaxID=1921 RepID=UPI00332FCD7F
MTDLHEPWEPLDSYPDESPQRHAPAAMLGRCVLGADSKEDCSTEGTNLQLNVRDDTTRRDIVEDGTTGCVAHSVDLGDYVTARIRLGATPDAVVGSVHAVSEDDVLLVGSPSGSRLARTRRVPARRSEWSVPSNSFPTWRRLRENHGQTTFIGKILIVEREAFPERGAAVLTRDTVGFRAASRRATRPVPMEVSCRRNDPSPNCLLHMVG